METESWLERAERLRLELDRELGVTPGNGAKARETIAHWLKVEFAGVPPEDTAQLPLHFDLTTPTP